MPASARPSCVPFVAIQVAFGLVVLFVGSLLVLSFAKVSAVNPGFATSDVLLISLETIQRVDARQQRAALIDALDRLRAVPGVQAVSSAEYSPLGRAWTHNVRVPGTQHEWIEATMAPVMDGFFETMKIPIVDGRAFVPADLRSETATAIVVNETFAARYFGRDRAVGRTLAGAVWRRRRQRRPVRDRRRRGRHQIRPPQAGGSHDLHPAEAAWSRDRARSRRRRSGRGRGAAA